MLKISLQICLCSKHLLLAHKLSVVFITETQLFAGTFIYYTDINIRGLKKSLGNDLSYINAILLPIVQFMADFKSIKSVICNNC